MGKDLKGKELGSGITQRKDGRYCGRYVDRFGNRKSVYGSSVPDLKRKLNEHIFENEQQLNIVEPKTTLDQWYEKWLAVYKIPCIRRNTLRHYNSIYRKHISPVLGKMKIKDITKLQIQALINELDKKGYEHETQNKVRVLLTDIFNRALQDYFVNRNPALGVKTCKDKPTDERRVLTEDEQAIFMECSAGRFYHNFFEVELNSGLRPGEMAALTEDMLDFENKTISVEHTLVYQKYEGEEHKTFHLELPKTKQSVRKVPMNKACELALKCQIVQKRVIERKYPNKTKFKDLLFVTTKNNPINSQSLCDNIKRVLDDINIMRDTLEQFEPFSAHTFRHTFATRCLEAGIEPKVIQKYLGHASLKMTMDLYVHVTDDQQQDNMEKFESKLDKICVSEELVEARYEESKKKNKVVEFGAFAM